MNSTLKFKLLEHPFYQAWEQGEITEDQLSKYGISYLDFISDIPKIWKSVIDDFSVADEISKSVVSDEEYHVELWKLWTSHYDQSDCPSLSYLTDELMKMSPSERLGAIQSFEIQQPDVAKTKKKGLLAHYGFDSNDLKYFDEHMNEKEHIDFGNGLRKKYANENEYQTGFHIGAELFYHALDKFI